MLIDGRRIGAQVGTRARRPSVGRIGGAAGLGCGDGRLLKLPLRAIGRLGKGGSPLAQADERGGGGGILLIYRGGLLAGHSDIGLRVVDLLLARALGLGVGGVCGPQDQRADDGSPTQHLGGPKAGARARRRPDGHGSRSWGWGITRQSGY